VPSATRPPLPGTGCQCRSCHTALAGIALIAFLLLALGVSAVVIVMATARAILAVLLAELAALYGSKRRRPD
jgi:hypothetical protein